jgi:hypothetical protein
MVRVGRRPSTVNVTVAEPRMCPARAEGSRHPLGRFPTGVALRRRATGPSTCSGVRRSYRAAMPGVLLREALAIGVSSRPPPGGVRCRGARCRASFLGALGVAYTQGPRKPWRRERRAGTPSDLRMAPLRQHDGIDAARGSAGKGSSLRRRKAFSPLKEIPQSIRHARARRLEEGNRLARVTVPVALEGEAQNQGWTAGWVGACLHEFFPPSFRRRAAVATRMDLVGMRKSLSHETRRSDARPARNARTRARREESGARPPHR